MMVNLRIEISDIVSYPRMSQAKVKTEGA